MENVIDEKQVLIDEIVELLDRNQDIKTDINPKFFDFFEVDDLIDTKNGLIQIIEKFKNDNKDFLDEIFTKCS